MDIFSLAIVYYYMWSGTHPFSEYDNVFMIHDEISKGTQSLLPGKVSLPLKDSISTLNSIMIVMIMRSMTKKRSLGWMVFILLIMEGWLNLSSKLPEVPRLTKMSGWGQKWIKRKKLDRKENYYGNNLNVGTIQGVHQVFPFRNYNWFIITYHHSHYVFFFSNKINQDHECKN